MGNSCETQIPVQLVLWCVWLLLLKITVLGGLRLSWKKEMNSLRRLGSGSEQATHLSIVLL